MKGNHKRSDPSPACRMPVELYVISSVHWFDLICGPIRTWIAKKRFFCYLAFSRVYF